MGVVMIWYFELESFVLLVQECGDQMYVIFNVFIGLLLEIYCDIGEKVWFVCYNLWGRWISEEVFVVEVVFDISLCFVGQWVDEELGLYYNLNCYYDFDSGCYFSIDLIVICGGYCIQGYVQNLLWEMDLFGLVVCE